MLKLTRRLCVVSTVLFSLAGSTQQSQAPNQTPKALYERGLNALQGSGPSRDAMRGIDDIKSAATANYTPAQFALAYFYDTGSYVSQSSSEATRWYRKAAEGDDGFAEYATGRAYYVGGAGSGRDLNEAKKWLVKAADKGIPQAQYLLGKVMETLDYKAAPEFYRRAAEVGFPLAQYRLGLALASGRGIPIDRAEAYGWLLLSYEAHVDAAATPLSDLESFLGTNGTEAAKSRARDLEKSMTRAAHPSGCQGWAGELDEIPSVPPPQIRQFCP